MNNFSNDEIDRVAKQYSKGVPGLFEELKTKLAVDKQLGSAIKKLAVESFQPDILTSVVPDNRELRSIILSDESELDVKPERIIVIELGGRPVARIRNNRATTEFLGVGSETWGKVITEAQSFLDQAIPSVGRVELTNCELPWAGTGWLIDHDIIVTNAHVAEVFAKMDHSARYVFKPGPLNGYASCNVDFLEEEGRIDELSFDVAEVLWIAPHGEADVAFLRIKREGSVNLAPPIKLARTLENDSTIAAIGFPARDRSVDQKRVIQIFGDDVYDKKRLAPGKLIEFNSTKIVHDCSTLGGNSGSLLIDLKTGLAVGLHQGGLLDESANLGIIAPHLQFLLDKVKNRSPLNVSTTEYRNNQTEVIMPIQTSPEGYTIRVNVPLEITVKFGTNPIVSTANVVNTPSGIAGTLQSAVEKAKREFGSDSNVVNIRTGYRFKNGWITDEQVVVIEVKEKLSHNELVAQGKKTIREIDGIGVDIRTAALPDGLEEFEVDLAVMERPGKAAKYEEPPGYKDTASPVFLGRAKRKMSAIFHVSPDAGFKHLKEFFERIETHVTATIYEWEINHISDLIDRVISRPNKNMKMVTQRVGVGEKLETGDATRTAVEDMKTRLGNKFKHTWASTHGPERLVPGFYHIKVASRDGEEFWLSSGNWKDSNQPENVTIPAMLKSHNREWHAIVKDKKLATLFQKYIEWDFEQAKLHPLPIQGEAAMSDIEFFVPIVTISERQGDVTYDNTLVIQDEMLDIQPLLTPDRDTTGERIFLKAATEMVERATSSLYIQNQSFNYTDDNNKEFNKFFEAVRKKQRAIDDVRIIIRNAKEYGRQKDIANQVLLLERLKDFGINVSSDSLRLQYRCHTKGIIVDGKEVLLGSQNMTNGGSLFNRDASLLVRTPRVAEFFQKIFLYDWEYRADNDADGATPGVRRARPGEETPEGFRRVTLQELLMEKYS
jgi:hypothetical protein